MNVVQQRAVPLLLFQLTRYGRLLGKAFQLFLCDLFLPFQKWKQNLWMMWAVWDGIKRNHWTWALQHCCWREQGMRLFSTEGYFMLWFKPGHWDSASCVSGRHNASIVSCFWKSKSSSHLLLKCQYDFKAEVMLFLLRAVVSSISEVFC